MARPNKTGLEYYNVDSDLFQNRKVKRLVKAFNGKGFLIYMYVLTEIYRDNGCFIEWDENTAFDVSDSLNVAENLVHEVIEYCCVVGLFDKGLLTSEGILTSKNIQHRWEKISKDAKRTITKVSQINESYSLLPEETELITEETQKTTEESTQRKEKESKEDNTDTSPSAEKSFKQFSEDDLYNSLRPFVKTYGPEMIREFYDYWREPMANKKPRMTAEKAWDVSRRLRTWNAKRTVPAGAETLSPRRKRL